MWTKFTKKWCFVEDRKSEHHHWISNYSYKFQLKKIILFFRTKLTQKGYFGFKTEKVYTTEFRIFKFAKIYTKFQFKLTVLIFWTKFAQKGYFQSKTQEMHTTKECSIFIGTKFQLKLIILFFWIKFDQKGYFQKHRKKKQPHWILHIQISLDT